MPRLQAIVLLSTLLSGTAFGAGLDPVRVGRYSALVAGPAPEQVDLFALPVRTEFPRSVLSVGGTVMRCTAFALCFVVSLPSAALEVIRDTGGEPIGPYPARLEPREVNAGGRGTPLPGPGLTSSPAEPLKHYLPIRPPSLTPGHAEARKLSTHLLQPLFLVGSDPESLRWLAANRERLTQLHAVGMLVQADTMAEVQAVTAAARGLPLLPASGEAFATELGIRHYPVLITSEGIGP